MQRHLDDARPVVGRHQLGDGRAQYLGAGGRAGPTAHQRFVPAGALLPRDDGPARAAVDLGVAALQDLARRTALALQQRQRAHRAGQAVDGAGHTVHALVDVDQGLRGCAGLLQLLVQRGQLLVARQLKGCDLLRAGLLDRHLLRRDGGQFRGLPAARCPGHLAQQVRRLGHAAPVVEGAGVAVGLDVRRLAGCSPQRIGVDRPAAAQILRPGAQQTERTLAPTVGRQ